MSKIIIKPTVKQYKQLFKKNTKAELAFRFKDIFGITTKYVYINTSFLLESLEKGYIKINHEDFKYNPMQTTLYWKDVKYLVYYSKDNLIIHFDEMDNSLKCIAPYILKNDKDKRVKCLKKFKKSLSKHEKELCLQFFNNNLCKAYGFYNRWCNNYNENFTPSVWLKAYSEMMSLAGWSRYNEDNNWIYQKSMEY